MLFEEVFCEAVFKNDDDAALKRMAKLHMLSKKCKDNPEHGVTFTIPGAKNVIRDCAIAAYMWIPVAICISWKTVPTYLKKSMSEEIVDDFINRKASPREALLSSELNSRLPSIEKTTSKTSENFDDVYGGYGMDNAEIDSNAEENKIKTFFVKTK